METLYNALRTYGRALPLIPFSIPVIEHHVQTAKRACIDCLGQWFLNFFESGIYDVVRGPPVGNAKFQLAISNHI
jgi:hypothetical protein